MRGRRVSRAPAAGAFFVAVIAPAVAEAQLFPNLPTRNRQRIDCSQELPVYGLYRNKYHGYFPTCWRQFPPGWGCPSLESPNWEAELARQPLDIPDDGGEGLGGPGGLDPFGSGLEDLLPDLPRARSPFELDAPDEGGSPFDPPRRAPSPFDPEPARPGLPGGPAGGPLDRPAGTPPSPFDLPGASNSPSDLPSLAPPVAESGLSAGGTFASASDGAPVPELAVIPDGRPRPVRLPSHATGPVELDGPFSDASAPMGPPPGALPPMAGMPPAVPIGEFPGMIEHGPRGVILSEPTYSAGEPFIVGPSEGRPRRRILSGLFGRGN